MTPAEFHLSRPDSCPALWGHRTLYLNKYLDTSYRSTFPWVDHIAEVSKRTLIDQLDQAVVEKIAARDLDGIWMAVPDVLDWQQVDGFQWSGRGQPLHHDVHLDGFLESVTGLEFVNAKTLKQRKVSWLNHEGVEVATWTAYRCLYAQLDQDGQTFLLSGGKWYRLTRDFVSEVNEAYQRIPRYEHELPAYSDGSETAYNERVAGADSARYALMDAKNIPYGGSPSSVEFCDLLVDKRDIVHIKRYGASSLLSHLFSQGLTSGELFQTDPEFRRRVNELLPAAHRLADPGRRPTVDEYRVVFAVISRVPGELTLPFFSRLNLKHAARRLVGFGYRVSLAKIAVDETYSKLKRYQ